MFRKETKIVKTNFYVFCTHLKCLVTNVASEASHVIGLARNIENELVEWNEFGTSMTFL